jgi:hypothetical protein
MGLERVLQGRVGVHGQVIDLAPRPRQLVDVRGHRPSLEGDLRVPAEDLAPGSGPAPEGVGELSGHLSLERRLRTGP